jgi:hypothetical protein
MAGEAVHRERLSQQPLLSELSGVRGELDRLEMIGVILRDRAKWLAVLPPLGLFGRAERGVADQGVRKVLV